ATESIPRKLLATKEVHQGPRRDSSHQAERGRVYRSFHGKTKCLSKGGGGGSSQSVKEESPANLETPRNKPQTKLRQATGKFKAPPPMTGPVENRNKNKFCEFHGYKGHSTDECIHLRRQIEEAVRSGQLSHSVKEIKQGGKRGEHAKAPKKGETPNKEKAMAVRLTVSLFLSRKSSNIHSPDSGLVVSTVSTISSINLITLFLY
ncbi:hypothetical protein Tco_0020959, partial [Tanacetum coccineum]